MLILSPVFVSLLQSQIIAFAVQCRSFTPSRWTERSLNKSQNRQFTIITMYQVTFNPNSSHRTSLHCGRWLTGINTPQYFVRIPCVDLDRSLRGRRPRRRSVPAVVSNHYVRNKNAVRRKIAIKSLDPSYQTISDFLSVRGYLPINNFSSEQPQYRDQT